MRHTPRLWPFILLAAVLLLLLAFGLPYLNGTPATAQGPTAAVPTLTPTKTPAEVVGGDQISWLIELWNRFGWWALPLAVVAGIIGIIFRFGVGIGGGAEEAGKRTFERVNRSVAGLGGGNKAIRTYLKNLRNNYEELPVIGVATEQVHLDIASVHVPLQMWEWDEAEGHQRRMRGEEERSTRRRTNLFGELPSKSDSRIFKLLSDPAELARRRRAWERQRTFAKRLPESLRRYILPDEPQRVQPRGFGDDEDHNPFVEQADATSRLLLLGGAGSGKTMTLRYAALRCADAYERGGVNLGDELGLYLREAPLPIYIRLTLFAQTLPDDIRELPLAEREQYLGAQSEECAAGWRRAAPTTMTIRGRRRFRGPALRGRCRPAYGQFWWPGPAPAGGRGW